MTTLSTPPQVQSPPEAQGPPEAQILELGVDGALNSKIWEVVGGVLDPEMPPVTIGELGMVLSVVVEGTRATVEVMPTFSGCPAIAYIGQDIQTAALAVEGITDVEVVWRRDIGWGPERISESGKAKLTEAGIAPPGSGQGVAGEPPPLLSIGGVTCPYCGSRNTRADSPFGSAPCRSTHSCRNCKTPFDAIKAF